MEVFSVIKAIIIILSLLLNFAVSTTVSNLTDRTRSSRINGSCAMQLQGISPTICDDHINLYLTKNLETNPPSAYPDPDPALAHNSMSTVWKYVNEKYGPFKPDKLLSVILQKNTNIHNNTEAKEDSDCISLYKDNSEKNCSIIKCNVSSLANSSSLLDEVIVQMGVLALKLSTRTDTWPGHDMSGSSAVLSILVYDIYSGVGQEEKARQWKAVKLNESSSSSSSSNVNDAKICAPKAVFWFRDWYLRIYDGYGNSTLKIFFSLLSEHWPIPMSNGNGNGNGNGRQLNAGEFVHFWSGASCANLIDLANATFGWNQGYQMELNKARNDFPEISLLYPCPKCDVINTPGKIETNKRNVYLVVVGLLAFIIILMYIGFSICRVLIQNKNKVKRRLAERTTDLWISRGCGEIVSTYTKVDDESAELQLLQLDKLFFNNTLGIRSLVVSEEEGCE